MSKKTLTDEELFAQFEDIPSATPDASKPSPSAKAGKHKDKTKDKPTSKDAPQSAAAAEDDPLAELTALAAARPASRPTTPRISSSTAGARRIETPVSSSPKSGRTSLDKSRTGLDAANTSRKSTDSNRTTASAKQTQDQDQDQDNASSIAPAQSETGGSGSGGGGGWWGTVFSAASGAASAAVKQAEAAVNEIKANEEAMKWAQQVRGNVEKVKAYGDNVRSLAIPTFTNILETIAPPISAHERLLIHTSHDILGYPSMDPLIYTVFARVMAQVEGGDLMVIQRGSESRARGRSSSEAAYRGSTLTGGGGSAGWTDGPWWRENTKRDLAAIKGLVEGSKLSRASAEAYAQEYFAAMGGVEAAAKSATESLSETNPVRNSDIFLSIQAISGLQRDDLFAAGSGQKSPDAAAAANNEAGVVDPEAKLPDETAFAIYLDDPVHSIACSTVSQTFPTKWSDWLDAVSPADDSEAEADPSAKQLPQQIRDLIEAGGIDPREWAAEWLEEILSLAVGVVAQSYVAKRMGVGAGAISRGKARSRAEEGTAGEAARAI